MFGQNLDESGSFQAISFDLRATDIRVSQTRLRMDGTMACKRMDGPRLRAHGETRGREASFTF